MTRLPLLALVAAGSIFAGAVGARVVADTRAEAAKPARVLAMRRLSETQYRNSIADVFGEDVSVNGRFEPESRRSLLYAIGAGALTVTAAGFEQYFAIGDSVAEQVFDAKRRGKLVGCASPDAACAAGFAKTYGERLFGRPLTDTEITSRINLFKAAEAKKQDGWFGMRLVLTSLLADPQFLFRHEVEGRTPGTLDAHSKAERLSFTIWDSVPDAALMAAAEKGELDTAGGRQAQVDRLLASPKAERGMRAFFTDVLQLDGMGQVTKDPDAFPKFNANIANSAREQVLRTVMDVVLTRDADYRDILTTTDAFIDRNLAAIYKLPYTGDGGWQKVSLPKDGDHAGLLTQVAFLSMFAHPARSSPTRRGAALGEMFLCQPTPLPPGDVDFSIVNDTSNATLKTVRARLEAHAGDESCAFCHTAIDPMGLALEQYDAIGQRRTEENGEPIDVSAEIDGRKFTGAKGLGETLHENPRVSGCLVRNLFSYGTGRAPSTADKATLKAFEQAFVAGNYRVKALIRTVATSDAFFTAPPQSLPAPPAKGPATTVASLALRPLKGATR